MNRHVAYDEQLAERVRKLVARRKNVVEKKMFGGIGYLLNGNLCVGIWKESIVARVGPDAYATALREPFVSEFDITGRAMTGWVLVAPAGIENDADLKAWWQRSLGFVATLPAK